MLSVFLVANSDEVDSISKQLRTTSNFLIFFKQLLHVLSINYKNYSMIIGEMQGEIKTYTKDCNSVKPRLKINHKIKTIKFRIITKG